MNMKIVNVVKSFLYLLRLKAECWIKGAVLEIGKDVLIDNNVRICCSPGSKLVIGDKVRIAEFSRLYVMPGAELVIRSSTGIHNYFHASQRIIVEEEVCMALRVVVVDSAHRFKGNRVAISRQWVDTKKICIGTGSWLGAGVVILCNVAEGMVVGANSVLTKEFEPFSVVGGNSAKLLYMRKKEMEE